MAFPYPYPGPVALYNNVPINAQFYEPTQFFIASITNGQLTLVQTTVNHNYVVGQLCRLVIPNANMSYELNEQTGYVIAIPQPNQVILNINSQGYNTFVTTTQPNQPQILAIGDVNMGAQNTNPSTTGTFVPGSFINISPL